MAYGAILGQAPSKPVDTIASGNMNAVTSNAVYEAFANLPAGVQIATGSYVGTGTYGSSNPNSLTLNFKAKIMIVARHGDDMGDQFNEMLIMSYAALAGIGIIESYQGIQNGYVLSLSGNTHNWYAQNASVQMNSSGVTYDYVAIG